MEPVYPKSSIPKLKELIAVLEPYAPVWQEWTKSDECFLNEKEIKVILNYLMTGSHLKSASELNISILDAINTINKAKLRLCVYADKFEGWLIKKNEPTMAIN